MTNGKPKILVVDDEDAFRSVIVDLLVEENYVCSGADSGEAALVCLDEAHYDVVFTDLRMPGIDGITLLREIKSRNKNTEVILVTSHTSIDSTIESLRLGAYDYLIKPIEDIELVLAIVKRISDKLVLEDEKRKLLEDLRAKNIELDESRRNIAKHSHDIAALYGAEKEMLAGLDLKVVYKRSVTHLSRLVGARPALLWVFDDKKVLLELKAASHLGVMDSMDWDIRFPDPVIGLSEALKQALILKFEKKSALFHAVQNHKGVFGILAVLDPKKKAFENREKDMLARFSASVAIAVENACLYEEVKALSIRDGLTGLFNRRQFETVLAAEVLRSNRYRHPLSLILFDVDHFKHYNDTNGHPSGDAVLRSIASIVSNTIRDTDFACRYGGEEFVVVLPFTHKEETARLAETIRKRVAEHPFPHGQKQPGGALTLSVGIAVCPGDASEVSQLIQFADDALYQAKDNGRNRVC